MSPITSFKPSKSPTEPLWKVLHLQSKFLVGAARLKSARPANSFFQSCLRAFKPFGRTILRDRSTAKTCWPARLDGPFWYCKNPARPGYLWNTGRQDSTLDLQWALLRYFNRHWTLLDIPPNIRKEKYFRRIFAGRQNQTTHLNPLLSPRRTF